MARPFRYTLILVGAGLGTALAAVGGWHYARASAPLSGPIILISVDTLRADHLPVYGYQQVATPAIDALASDGIVFDRAYAHVPRSFAAHVAMLSGRLPFETGVRDDAGATIKPGERLLPQMLRERGYTTAGVVSASVLGTGTGISRGFDFFDADMTARSAESVSGAGRRDGGDAEKVAERWLDSIGTSRAFLFLHLDEPHRPYAALDRFPGYLPYDAEIAYTDEIVGRLVKYLKARQLYDRATIVLVSDHGEGLGDHGEQEHGLFVYDEAIHVPLVVKQEGNAGAGRHVPDPVQHIDLVPTVLDLVKAPISRSLRGRSLKPLLDGDAHFAERVIYTESMYGREHFGWSALATVTDGKYQYVRAPREELYDLERDPRERNNLASEALPLASAAAGAARQRLAAALDAITGPPDIERGAAGPGGPGGLGHAAPKGAPDSKDTPDPKDKIQILETYRRTLEWADERNWTQAIEVLQQTLRDEPTLVEVWRRLAEFAGRIDRFDLALEADWRVVTLQPFAPNGYLDAATTLFRLKRLDEARESANTAIDVASERDRRSRAGAHELLARVALAEHDADGARREAELAQQAEPLLPLTTYVDARLLYDQGQYADALPLFERTLAALQKANGAQIADLHLDTADTLVHLDRNREAEREYNEELRHFPQSTAARAGLAMLYQERGDKPAAERLVADITRFAPTPDSYATAARLWKSLGNARQANALRAEARKRFHKSN